MAEESEVKKMLSVLSMSREDNLYYSFVIGAVSVRYNLSLKDLHIFTEQFSQIIELAQQMNKMHLVIEFNASLMSGKIKSPLQHLEQLTDLMFKEEPQMMMHQDDDSFIKSINNEMHMKSQDDQKSLELAIQMQEEEQKEVEKRHIAQIDKDDEDWSCEICLEKMTDQQFWPLECKHLYHRNCLSQYFTAKISERNFPLKCPNEKCKREIENTDLREILSTEGMKKYEEFQLSSFIDSHSKDMSWCPSPGCPYAFVLEENQTLLICPLCRKRFCLSCKCEYHRGQTCAEYRISTTVSEADIKFEQFVRGQKFKQCFKCKMWVEKNQGCSHMTCRCGYQFCYVCGGQYGSCACMRH